MGRNDCRKHSLCCHSPAGDWMPALRTQNDIVNAHPWRASGRSPTCGVDQERADEEETVGATTARAASRRSLPGPTVAAILPVSTRRDLRAAWVDAYRSVRDETERRAAPLPAAG